MKSVIITLKVVFIILVGLLAITTGAFTGLLDGTVLAFILLGCLGMLLMSFSFPEIGRAFKHAFAGAANTGAEKEELRTSAYFWETAARNLIILGALRTVMQFVISLHYRGGLQEFFTGTRTSFLTIVYGMIPAALCGIAALAVKNKMEHSGGQEPVPRKSQWMRIETLLGYGLFIAVIIWTISPDLNLFSHWPSLLVVVGWALVLIVLMGNAAGGHGITLSFAVTGLIGTFIGFAKMFTGFVSANIQEISAGMTFSILSCVFAMLGMVLAGFPVEDHTYKAGKNGKGKILSRIAWYGIPILAVVLVFYAMIQATIPIVKK